MGQFPTADDRQGTATIQEGEAVAIKRLKSLVDAIESAKIRPPPDDVQ
jgi:hypothetical protein